MKIDRLMGILTLLMQNDKLTAPLLAARFEVSRRTILRDIEALCQAGVPVVTTQGGDGGISVMEGYKINKSVLTTDELQNLVSALKGIDSVSKTSNFESLMLKLAPEQNAMVSLASSVVIDLSSYYKESISEKIERIRQAIGQRAVIGFDYYYPKGEVRRTIEPYLIEFRWNAWYVFGWCRDREAFRRFKLNRLWTLALTGETYVSRPVCPEDIKGDDPFQETYQMLLSIDKSARFHLIEEYGMNCYQETENALLFTLGYANRDYAFNWVLGFCDKAEILEPEDARNEFAALVQKIGERYRT